MRIISDTQKILLKLTGSALFSYTFTPSKDIDWDALFRESEMQAVSLLAFQRHLFPLMDEEIAKKIKKRLKSHVLGSAKSFKNHAYLHELMTKNDIPYCIVKGAASAHYYPDPMKRSMGDVDFYVPPKYLLTVENLLYAEGFERLKANNDHHVTFFKKSTHFELHFEPISMPKNDLKIIFSEYWEGLYDNAVFKENDPIHFKMPDEFLHGFILLTHLQTHLVSSGVGLRHLCDWLTFVNTFTEEQFVSLFRDKLKRVGLWKLAQYLCLSAVDFMGMPYNSWMGDDHDTAEALLKDILDGGNFGRKDKQRSYSGLFIPNKKSKKTRKNRIAQGFSSLNKIVDGHWKCAKKVPILYPIGWVWFLCRFAFRCLIGKRKLNFIKMFSQSKKRKNLYEKLSLLVPEE